MKKELVFIIIVYLNFARRIKAKENYSLFDSLTDEKSSNKSYDFAFDVKSELECKSLLDCFIQTKNDNFEIFKKDQTEKSFFENIPKFSHQLKGSQDSRTPQELQTNYTIPKSPERSKETNSHSLKEESKSLFDQFDLLTKGKLKNFLSQKYQDQDILLKEKEALKNLPFKILEGALQTSKEKQNGKTIEKSLNLIVNAAQSFFVQEASKFNDTEKLLNKYKIINKKEHEIDDMQLSSRLFDQFQHTLESSFNLNDENFKDYVAEIRQNRLHDLLLAIKIIETMKGLNKTKYDQEMELLLARSLFKTNLNSLDDSSFDQRNALDSIMKALEKNLEQEKTEDSISRIFTLSKDNFSPSLSYENDYDLSDYKIIDFRLKKKIIPGLVVPLSSPRRVTAFVQPTSLPPTAIPSSAQPFVSLESSNPPLHLPNHATFLTFSHRNSPINEDTKELYLSEFNSNKNFNKDFYLSPHQEDLFIRSFPVSSESIKYKNSKIINNEGKVNPLPKSSLSASEESKKAPDNPSISTDLGFHLQSEYQNLSDEEIDCLHKDNNKINVNHHYHYMPYPVTKLKEQETQKGLDNDEILKSEKVSGTSSHQAKDSSYTSLNASPMQTMNPLGFQKLGFHTQQTDRKVQDVNADMQISAQENIRKNISPLESTRYMYGTSAISPGNMPHFDKGKLSSFDSSLSLSSSMYGSSNAVRQTESVLSSYSHPDIPFSPSSPPNLQKYIVYASPLISPQPYPDRSPPVASPNQIHASQPANPQFASYKFPLAIPQNSMYGSPSKLHFDGFPPAPPPNLTYGPPPVNPQLSPLRYPSTGAEIASNYSSKNPSSMSYTSALNQKDLSEPSVRTKVVFLRPKKGTNKGKKKKNEFSAFSVLFGNEPIRHEDSSIRDFNNQRNSLREEYWRSRELLHQQQLEVFELQRLKKEIQSQEKQREEIKKGILRNIFQERGGGLRDMFYRGALALGAMSLVPLASIIGRRKRSVNNSNEFHSKTSYGFLQSGITKGMNHIKKMNMNKNKE